MNRLLILRLTAVSLAIVALVLVSAAASWHPELTDSFPAADQVLHEAPDSIRLWFNQEPELELAEMSLEGESGTVEMGDVQATNDPKSFKARVLTELGSGSYRVTWRAAGSDGHVIRGAYDFEVHAHTGVARN